MTRRDVMKTMGGVTGAVIAWLFGAGRREVVTPQAGGYGYIDVATARHRGYLPAVVLLDGVDVSCDCFACDDRAGFVDVFKRNVNGCHYVDSARPRQAARERLYGVVTYHPTGQD